MFWKNLRAQDNFNSWVLKYAFWTLKNHRKNEHWVCEHVKSTLRKPTFINKIRRIHNKKQINKILIQIYFAINSNYFKFTNTTTNNLLQHQTTWNQHIYTCSSSILIYSISLHPPRKFPLPLNLSLWLPPIQRNQD